MPLSGARTDQIQPSHVKVWSAGTGGMGGLWLGNPLPVPLLRPAVELGLASREQAVWAGVLEEELDGGLDVLDEVWRLSHGGGG